MHFRYPLIFLCAAISACETKPVVKDQDLRIFDRNVLGFTYVVCASAVSWDGVSFTIEGLNVDREAKATKKFSIGKLDYKPAQIRQVDSMALSIDAIFRQMCQSTVALRNNPAALADYVARRDKTALEIFAVLRDMQAVNEKPVDADSKIAEQKKLLDQVSKTSP